LTEVYKLPKDRLYVTYFEGDSKQGLEPDTEARDIWRSVGVPDDHILTGNAKDNFWGESLQAVVLFQTLTVLQRWVLLGHVGHAAKYTMTVSVDATLPIS
jgi:hypothetical protein